MDNQKNLFNASPSKGNCHEQGRLAQLASQFLHF